MAGTASTVRSWLLIEHGGPWGREALVDGRLPTGLGERLARRALDANVRVLLVRRPGGVGSGRTAFAIRSGPERPWIRRIALERPADALELDLDRYGQGEHDGAGDGVDGALFLVCTHGRHDPCCAERGRPLAAAAAAAFPEQTWESSHFGGDRFAGNLVAFPHGYYFGRVGPGDVVAVARAYLEGRVALAHLRGRSCWPMPVQAAEHLLRERANLDRIDGVEVDAFAVDGRVWTVRFHTADGGARVLVELHADADLRRLTCRVDRSVRPPAYRLLGIEPLEGAK